MSTCTTRKSVRVVKSIFPSHIEVDGYTIDLSCGVSNGSILRYDGKSFKPSTQITATSLSLNEPLSSNLFWRSGDWNLYTQPPQNGDGSSLTITASNGSGSGSKNGGNLRFRAGDGSETASVNGDGGTILLSAGDASNVAGSAGSIELRMGHYVSSKQSLPGFIKLSDPQFGTHSTFYAGGMRVFETSNIGEGLNNKDGLTYGLTLSNGSVAKYDSQEYSPSLRFSGSAWSGGSTSAKEVDWYIQARPIQVENSDPLVALSFLTSTACAPIEKVALYSNGGIKAESIGTTYNAQHTIPTGNSTIAILDKSQTFNAAQGIAPESLIDDEIIKTDAEASNIFYLSLAGEHQLANPTGLVSGRMYAWIITQNNGGGHQLKYGSLFAFPNGLTPELSKADGSISVIRGIYNGTLLLCWIDGNFEVPSNE